MKKFFIKVFIISILGCFISNLTVLSQGTPKNWQWRGENRNGVYNETGLLKVWPTDGPQLLWKFDGLGEGHTSVAIANEKIYVTGMHDDRLILYLFDMAGKLIIEKEIGKEWNTSWNGTRSSVCINDGKLYIFNALGTLFCLDEKTLNEIWKKDLLTEFDGRNLMFGMTENPLIVGDTLFMTPGGEKFNMVALNKNTGALIWSSTGTGTPTTYCSPLFIGDQEVPVIVTWMAGVKPENAGRDAWIDNYIAAFNAGTGELLWTQTLPSQNDINPNMPLYMEGKILAATGYRGGTWLINLKNGGRESEIVWKNSEMDNQMHGLIKVGDYLYGSGHQNRNWFCVDWKTGTTIYKVPDLAPANVIYADGMLYVYSEKGTMNLVKPNPEKFELVSSFNVTLGTNQHWAHTVIHNGILYVRHGEALMAFKIK